MYVVLLLTEGDVLGCDLCGRQLEDGDEVLLDVLPEDKRHDATVQMLYCSGCFGVVAAEACNEDDWRVVR